MSIKATMGKDLFKFTLTVQENENIKKYVSLIVDYELETVTIKEETVDKRTFLKIGSVMAVQEYSIKDGILDQNFTYQNGELHSFNNRPSRAIQTLNELGKIFILKEWHKNGKVTETVMQEPDDSSIRSNLPDIFQY